MRLLLLVGLASTQDFKIIDADSDIRDLDVGDLDDMESDVTAMFLERLKGGPSSANAKMSFATLKWEWSKQAGLHGTEELGIAWHVSLPCVMNPF